MKRSKVSEVGQTRSRMGISMKMRMKAEILANILAQVVVVGEGEGWTVQA